MKIEIELTTLTTTLLIRFQRQGGRSKMLCVCVTSKAFFKHPAEPLCAIGCHYGWFWVFFVTFNSEE